MAIFALIAMSQFPLVYCGGAFGHMIHVKLPPMSKQMEFVLFRRPQPLQYPSPLLPVVSNVVTILSTATQKDYDVWAAWMPAMWPLPRYNTLPGDKKPAVYVGTLSFLQIIFYLCPIFAVGSSLDWMELFIYQMTGRGETGSRIDMRTSMDPRVWYYGFQTSFNPYDFYSNFWSIVAPSIFLPDGSINRVSWKILARFARGSTVPILPTGRSEALLAFRAMLLQSRGAAIEVPPAFLEWFADTQMGEDYDTQNGGGRSQL